MLNRWFDYSIDFLNLFHLPVVASLKNSDIIASIPKDLQKRERESGVIFSCKDFVKIWPINARITVSNGAAGNTIDALCSTIRSKSTENNFQSNRNFEQIKLDKPMKTKIWKCE